MSTNSKKHGPSIFISYRIADTLQVADRLAAGLRDTFGAEAVFFDRRTIEPGDAWNSEIESAVKGDWGMSDVLNLLNLHLGSPQVLLFACSDNHSSTQREHCTLSLRRKKTISRWARRRADRINPTGAKKVRSLADEVYKRKDSRLAWEKVK